MKFILATKQNMTQHFNEAGVVTPATLLNVGPISVTQVKTSETDGYESVQVGYGKKKMKSKINKAILGHIKGAGPFELIKEFRLEGGGTDYKVGDAIDVSVFSEGDKVAVSSTSKGKGFQGVVKRHNFAGGPRSHGQKHSEREPGSIGATGPQRVFKGMRMGGRMGSDRVTTKGLKVLMIDKENNQILVSGAVPGRRGTVVEIRG